MGIIVKIMKSVFATLALVMGSFTSA